MDRNRKEEMSVGTAVVKKEVKPLAANNLSKKKIEKLFRMFCIHTIEYEGGALYADDGNFSACIWCEITWMK